MKPSDEFVVYLLIIIDYLIIQFDLIINQVCGLCAVSFTNNIDGGIHVGIMHDEAIRVPFIYYICTFIAQNLIGLPNILQNNFFFHITF